MQSVQFPQKPPHKTNYSNPNISWGSWWIPRDLKVMVVVVCVCFISLVIYLGVGENVLGRCLLIQLSAERQNLGVKMRMDSWEGVRLQLSGPQHLCVVHASVREFESSWLQQSSFHCR